jgi:predicted short-subunit dehydrogenase-like oxidoreductase (DUF2520 family)
MTFGPNLYSLEHYESIPFFMIKEEVVKFPEVFAALKETLKNPVHSIAAQERIHYHASAVMISNHSMILWDAALSAGKLNSEITRKAFEPILRQTLQNFMRDGIEALTGPLARKDTGTIAAHLKSLESTPEAELYRAFVRYFESKRKEPFSHDLCP